MLYLSLFGCNEDEFDHYAISSSDNETKFGQCTNEYYQSTNEFDHNSKEFGNSAAEFG